MRRFFRFSVRDLFWLTLVVAVGLGWSVREKRWLARESSREEWWTEREQQLKAQVDAATLAAAVWEDRFYDARDIAVKAADVADKAMGRTVKP